MRFTDRPGVPRRITGFHTDEEGHWVADLECGHGQHVRHDPPLVTRPWVTTPEGRAGRLGMELQCVRCVDEGIPPSHPPRANDPDDEKRGTR